MPQHPSIPFAVPDIDEDDVEAVVRVLRSGWLTTGDECLLLEQELAHHLGIPHVVAVSSCTAALEIALAALRLPPGSRVGVPTWTFAASALAAFHQGHRPVLLDVEPDSLNLSVEALAAELELGLAAVVGVHFAGIALPAEVHRLCRDAGVPLVEDAAHAMGARDHRGLVNGAGTAGACFSFYATKNLTSGEGGALTTDDDALAEFARVYRLHGLSRDAWARYHPEATGGYDVVEPGIKANLPDLLAALARAQLARFEALQARRRQIVLRYRDNLSGVPDLRFVPARHDPAGADHLVVVLLPEAADRQAVRERLTEARIGTSVHFQPLHHLQWFASHAAIGLAGLRTAEAAAPRALSLPLHPGLGEPEIDRVCSVLVEALRA